MRPISINLASRPFYNTTLYLIAYTVSIGFLLLASGLNVYMFVSDQIAMADVRQARATLEREMAGLERQQTEVERDLRRINFRLVGTQSEFAGDVILQRVFSWTLLFNRLEHLVPPDIKLRSIRPVVHMDRIVIRLIGLAKNAQAITDFEEALIESPLFADVYPNSETFNPALRGITFDLSFVYLPKQEEIAPEPGQDADADVARAAAGEAPSAGGQP